MAVSAGALICTFAETAAHFLTPDHDGRGFLILKGTAMTARKSTAKDVDQVEVVERDTTEDTAGNDVVAEDTRDATAELDVTLSNGAELTIEVIKDQGDWAYEAVEAMAEMNYAVLINAIITKSSKFKLKAAGARVRDFEMITEKVSEALGVIKDEADAEKRK